MGKNKFNNKFSNLESTENTQKYVKEMYDLAEKHEKKSIMSFLAIGIPIVVILIFTLVQMISFSVHSSKDGTKQIVSKKDSIKKDTNKSESNKFVKKDDKKVAPVNELNNRLFNYLKLSEKRAVSYYRAKQLNNKSEKGIASIFVAQVLRDNGYKIDNSIINTASLVRSLQKDGWKIISDCKQLQKGDICFTTAHGSSGPPAHTYFFMGWVKEGKTDSAYVADSQVSEYKNTYHTRNISSTTPTKEKFSFFMRK
ncbi:peptidoglycan amidohydrolase family protein [Clostridium haemolyticum]|uniref:Bacteriophage lysin domain-containing protein n=1 Tax=Clostridium haemolyticum NCTC 9693 TaxID=1443114 RepID=A0ABR4TCH9_CLOHA|nr:peptidoglycan amidohydrolase family protein [Clostridium haemolyticum]KEI15528.1 hypothetical protein Z960_00450 [Clostridium haemolyticum NCTC 9693]KGN04787.1 hypothetical protein Z961_00970 [Clostridium haemolyticum NCTC 8350]